MSDVITLRPWARVVTLVLLGGAILYALDPGKSAALRVAVPMSALLVFIPAMTYRISYDGNMVRTYFYILGFTIDRLSCKMEKDAMYYKLIPTSGSFNVYYFEVCGRTTAVGFHTRGHENLIRSLTER